ncbi:MAG: hypothetical protein CML31_14225 [Rhizobiales bacterium]|nr:hypothetical protein [Hoeflea sp.]MBG21087.1 hypothetical protein [Hyphomicrobiales bacterium]
MTRPMTDELEEKPLDPEMEKVRRKMVRLLAVSIGIMFVGVMAVLAAIVYKFTRPSEDVATLPAASSTATTAPSSTPLVDRIDLPQGFDVISMSVDGNRIAFFGTTNGASQVLVYDASSGSRLGTIEVGQ